MRWAMSLILGSIALGGCEKKGDDGPEVVLISADAGGGAATAAPDAIAATGAAGAPDSTGATTAADVGGASALREKLLALAVASECLRRGGTPPEQSANTMLALYKAHGIDLDTYTREMSRLAGDPTFQAEIDAKTGDCPAAPVVALDTAITTAPDIVPPAADTGPETVDTTVAAAPDTGPVVDAGAPAVADTTPAADTTPVIDTTPVADTAPVADVAEPEADFSGTWTGQLYGGATPGTLRMTIKGRTVTAATVTFGRISIRLKGGISDKGALNVGGTSGKDYIRVTGQVQRTGKAINGTWDGVVDRKKGNGRLLLKK